MAIIAFVDDLMDRSRVTNALTDVRFTRNPDDARDAAVVLVDLARHAPKVRALRELAPTARIIAFGPHVDTEASDQALADGADVVLPRSRFFADPVAATST
jgi:hypothetical protein